MMTMTMTMVVVPLLLPIRKRTMTTNLQVIVETGRKKMMEMIGNTSSSEKSRNGAKTLNRTRMTSRQQTLVTMRHSFDEIAPLSCIDCCC